MKRWVGPLLVFAALALASHWLVLSQAPSVIMSAALDRLADRGVPLHRFVLSPPMTPQTQTIVRPAPDLSYSICRYDFRKLNGALSVRMEAYPAYGSLSFFDGNTNNYLTLRGEGEKREVLLVGPDASAVEDAIRTPTATGIVLIRRVTPDGAARARVEAAARTDLCAPV